MRILLTNHQLAHYAGSELYTLELAKALTRAGHHVVVYSRYIDKLEDDFREAGIELVSSLDQVSRRRFDIAHVHHHINALEVRLAFPQLPIFYLSHGARAFLEHVPAVDVNITKYGAISPRVRKSLITQGVRARDIVMIHNIVDDRLFQMVSPARAQLRRALVLSNTIDPKTLESIRRACRLRGITLLGAGMPFRAIPNRQLPALIESVDVVFTIGRGVVETVICGRLPFVIDFAGADGFLTRANCATLEKHHFNGMASGKRMTAAQIGRELNNYTATEIADLRQRLLARYAPKAGVRELEKIYEATIRDFVARPVPMALVEYIVETVRVTRLHTFSRSELSEIHRHVRQVRTMLSALKRSFLAPLRPSLAQMLS